jgi:hypothetical protein
MMRRGPRPLTAAQQELHLRTSRVFTGETRLRRGALVWRGGVRPTPLSRAYQIRLDYRAEQTPRVTVETPDLRELADGRRLPHVYRQAPPCLCLYLPGTGQWRPQLRLDETMLPWSALWFFYFEEWLESDDWKGGGQHPADGAAPVLN